MSEQHGQLYGRLWRKLRAAFLRANPLCRVCLEAGKTVPATVVDHITPHRGCLQLFWDQSNWQSLCKPDHDSYKQRLEKSGRIAGCDANGMPLDPNHAWNKSATGRG